MIRKPFEKFPNYCDPVPRNFEKQIATGFLYMGGFKTAKFSVQFPKEIFLAGETSSITVHVDNTQVNKALEPLKLKLEMTI